MATYLYKRFYIHLRWSSVLLIYAGAQLRIGKLKIDFKVVHIHKLGYSPSEDGLTP